MTISEQKDLFDSIISILRKENLGNEVEKGENYFVYKIAGSNRENVIKIPSPQRVPTKGLVSLYSKYNNGEKFNNHSISCIEDFMFDYYDKIIDQCFELSELSFTNNAFSKKNNNNETKQISSKKPQG